MLVFNGITLINSCSHSITIRLKHGEFITVPPSDLQIRLKSRFKVMEKVSGLELAELELRDEYNSFKSYKLDYENKQFTFMGWRFDAGTIIICSKIVAVYAKKMGIPDGIFAVPDNLKITNGRKFCLRLAFLK